MRLIIWSICVVLMTPRPAASEVIQFYVAPDGKDEWSGRLKRPAPEGADGPFATIHRAQKAVREFNKGQKQRRPVTVFIRGTHYLEKPVVFTREDSGTVDCPVIYTALAGEKPVLSGGRRVVEWKETKGGVWKAKLPKEMAGKINPRQLFINGRRAVRARSPDTGYFKVEGLIDPKAGAKWNEGVDKFRFKPGDILPWKELNDIEVIVFHSWNTSRVRIASVDEKQSIVTFTGPTVFRPLGWDPNQRYYVENALEVLDSPGEWYCDPQTGIVHYRPLPGEKLNAAEVIAPMLGELLRFDGNADEGKFVEHVQVRGLSLRHSDWALPDKGYGDPQAAVTVPAAVMADGAIQCAIEECEIAHVGTYALWLRRGCKDNRIVQNHIHDMGAGGVRIGQSSMAKEDVAESSRNLISNNYIHDGGNVYPEGVSIWLAQSSHNRISHNEIHSFNYSGMSIGWNWGYQRNRTDHNTTENNHIHHVVRGVLSDGGGIYTLGTQTGSVLRNNLIHDVFPYMGKPTMAWGIYLDQASNGMLIENNIVYNTLTGGVMNTASPGNTIRNNIFAMSGWHGAWRWKWQQEPPTVVERNIFYLSRGVLFHEDGGLSDFKTRWNRNLYWRSDGEPLLFYDYSFEEWQAKGMDEHSIVADPKFIDAGKGDFRLSADSPAHKLGFKPIDASKAGLIGPTEWVSLPKGAVFPPTRFPALPPEQLPVLADDGFEETDTGAPPRQARLYEEGKSDSIRVTAEASATGKRSLKFTDAPGLEHVWNPHMFYTPHLKSGLATLDFDLRLEEGAVFTHEWRDSKHPFTVGPSIRINPNGKLLAGGKPIAEVPSGKWIHVKIVCGLGKRATGNYSLSLTIPDEKARLFEGMPCAPTFRRLEWLGFVSLAEKHSVFYLDNVRLERKK